jgi:hypothetical protein
MGRSCYFDFDGDFAPEEGAEMCMTGLFDGLKAEGIEEPARSVMRHARYHWRYASSHAGSAASGGRLLVVSVACLNQGESMMTRVVTFGFAPLAFALLVGCASAGGMRVEPLDIGVAREFNGEYTTVLRATRSAITGAALLSTRTKTSMTPRR